ncbi:6826_t:CDS:1, partial [Scutellospora calospora]
VRTKKPRTTTKSVQKQGRIKSPRKRSRNKISKTTPVAALQGSIVDTLVTFNSKKGRYERILNKNGKTCKRYPEGIFVEHISRNGQIRYSPVHKLIQTRLN